MNELTDLAPNSDVIIISYYKVSSQMYQKMENIKGETGAPFHPIPPSLFSAALGN